MCHGKGFGVNSLVSAVITLTIVVTSGLMATSVLRGNPGGMGKADADKVSWDVVSVQDQQRQKTIEITSNPKGADVYLDKVLMGTTPLVIPGVSIGPHALELKLSDRPRFGTTIQVREKNEPFTYQLTKPALLKVTSNVPQAEVLIEETFYGRTPHEEQFQPGEYNVRVRKGGYFDSLVVVNLVEGERREIKVDLRPVVARGTLEITSIPAVADIWLDAKSVGKSPVKIPDLPTGSHLVRASKPGYPDVVQNVLVTGEANQTVKIDLAAPPPLTADQFVTLEIEVEPATATLTLDGSPFPSPGGKASKVLRPGKHIVTASLDGYRDQELAIELEPGKNQRIPVKLELRGGSNFIYYLAGGSALVVGGYFLYKELTKEVIPPPKDYGPPPAFPNPNL